MPVFFLKNFAKDSRITKIKFLGLLVPHVSFESINRNLLLRLVVWAEVGPEVVTFSFLLIILGGDTATAHKRQWCLQQWLG